MRNFSRYFLIFSKRVGWNVLKREIAFENPFEAYMKRLYLAARSTEEESCLGMARMAYEAEALLDFAENENEQITVQAVIPLAS